MTFEEWWHHNSPNFECDDNEAEEIWEAATKAEREACAQACSAIALGDSKTEAEEIAAYKCEAAIRAL